MEEGEEGQFTVGATPCTLKTSNISLTPQDVHSRAHKQTQCKHDIAASVILLQCRPNSY